MGKDLEIENSTSGQERKISVKYKIIRIIGSDNGWETEESNFGKRDAAEHNTK